jgi:hypothetical protein
MQMEVPGVQDVSGEPESIKTLYGLDQENTKKFGKLPSQTIQRS